MSDSLPARPVVPGEVLSGTFEVWWSSFPCWLLGHKHGADDLLRRKEAEGYIVGDSDHRPCARCVCWLSPREWDRSRPLKRPLWTRGIQDGTKGGRNFGAGPWGTWEIRVQWSPRLRVWFKWYGRRRQVWEDELERWVPARKYA